MYFHIRITSSNPIFKCRFIDTVRENLSILCKLLTNVCRDMRGVTSGVHASRCRQACAACRPWWGRCSAARQWRSAARRAPATAASAAPRSVCQRHTTAADIISPRPFIMYCAQTIRLFALFITIHSLKMTVSYPARRTVSIEYDRDGRDGFQLSDIPRAEYRPVYTGDILETRTSQPEEDADQSLQIGQLNKSDNKCEHYFYLWSVDPNGKNKFCMHI